MDWEEKTNSEIRAAIDEMVGNHESLRLELLKGYDVMVSLEEECLKCLMILKDRGINL